MGRRRSTVKRDPGILDPALLYFPCDIRGDERTVRAERHLDPLCMRMAGELPDIVTEQGFPAREEDQRDTHRGKVIDQGQRFGGRQLIFRIAARARPGIAVGAGKVAPVGQVPEDHRPAPFCKGKVSAWYLLLRVIAVMHHAAHGAPPMQALGDPVHCRSPPFSLTRTAGTRLSSSVLKTTVYSSSPAIFAHCSTSAIISLRLPAW